MHVTLLLAVTTPAGGPELFREIYTIPNTASSHTHAIAATRGGGGRGSKVPTVA